MARCEMDGCQSSVCTECMLDESNPEQATRIAEIIKNDRFLCPSCHPPKVQYTVCHPLIPTLSTSFLFQADKRVLEVVKPTDCDLAFVEGMPFNKRQANLHRLARERVASALEPVILNVSRRGANRPFRIWGDRVVVASVAISDQSTLCRAIADAAAQAINLERWELDGQPSAHRLHVSYDFCGPKPEVDMAKCGKKIWSSLQPAVK